MFFPKGKNYYNHNYEGLWYNKHYNYEIEIRQHRPNVIKVRKGRYGRWKRFEKCGYREFVNKRTVIKFKSKKSFVLKEGRKHKKLKFRKVGNSSGHYGHGYGYNEGYWGNDSGYSSGDYYGDYGNWNASDARKRIKGTWRSERPYAKLKIKTKGRDRIEVKDDRGRKYYYYQDNYRPNEFYNDRGSKYILISRYELLWKSADGRNEVRLYKD